MLSHLRNFLKGPQPCGSCFITSPGYQQRSCYHEKPRDSERSTDFCKARNALCQKLRCALPSDSKTRRQYIHRAPISHCWMAFHRSVPFTSWNAWGGRIAFHVYSKEFTWDPTKNESLGFREPTCLSDIDSKTWVQNPSQWTKGCVFRNRVEMLKEQLAGSCWREISCYFDVFGNCAFQTFDNRNQTSETGH